MAHEMIEEGKLLKMIYSVLHDSLLATATRLATATSNSATSPDNSTTIGRTTTETVDTSPTQYAPSNATTARDRTQSKHQSESRLRGDLNRQRTYEFEIEIPKPPNHPVNTYLTYLEHKQQKSPDTEITAPEQGELARNPKRAWESDGKYEEQNTTATPQGHNLDVGDGSASLTRTTTPQGHPDTWATEASTSRPDITRCIQVGSNTFVLRTKPGTSLGQRPQPVEDDYDSISVIDSSSPNDPVDSGKKRRLGQRARKTWNKNTPN
jgi:hypothetical protein